MQLQSKKMIPQKGFTHGGKFHADDVFSTALLRLINPKFKVKRGFEVPKDFDGIVYDIGMGRFDHHQQDKEIRENGIPYAAFGLLWREYGSIFLEEEGRAEFDKKFVQKIDESDNTGSENALSEAINSFNPSWDSEESFDQKFEEAVDIAEKILLQYIEKTKGEERAAEVVQKAMQRSDGIILELPLFAPWKKQVVGSSYQFVVYPSKRGGYCAQGVPVSEEDRTLVCDVPEEWCGLAGEELQRVSGVPEAQFCHATGFLMAADNKEAAIKMAELAIQYRRGAD